MSRWWYEVHRILDIKLLMLMSFHPQMDGVMEWANHSHRPDPEGFHCLQSEGLSEDLDDGGVHYKLKHQSCNGDGPI
jgi:hypothetical protein